MAKKVAKKATKSKLARSSTMDKTVEEGKDFVTQSTKVISKRNQQKDAALKKQQNQSLKKVVKYLKPKLQRIIDSGDRNARKVTKPKKSASKAGKKLQVRAAVPSAPAPVPAADPVPIARTGTKKSQKIARSASKNSQVIEQELHDRLVRHSANIGEMNFSLRWWDPNDLDLHVTCPCGTHIHYANKKCTTCGGELDIDMNAWQSHSLEPVEHIFFNNPKKGTYKIHVQYFSGPKTFGGVTGGQKSKFALSLHEGFNQILRYEDTVSNKQKQMHYDFTL